MIKVHMHVRCALCTTPCQTATTNEGPYAMVSLVIHSLATQDEKAPKRSKCNGLAEVGTWADGARL
jgi:succinate dehydrogenase/fumarate reductase-like Fe-S protein